MWVFDTSKDDLETLTMDYQAMAMRFLWERGEEGAGSRDIWVHVSEILKEENKTICRTSIIKFMNKMVDKGVFTSIERTGRGGYHKVYFPAIDEEGFKRSISDKVISKLLDTWPEEANAILLEKIS